MNHSEENQSDKRELSRRECLAWLARASAIALAGIATHTWAGDDAAGMVKIADLIKLPNETAQKVKSPNVFVTRTDKGVACLSTVCTHKRNALELDQDGCIYCPVHNSVFDLAGNPNGGPATRALTWYQADISKDGAISADVSKTVNQGQWAELPEWAKPKKK